MIKAAFFDIDGTLMAHSLGCVPEDTRRALEELKKRGVRVFTCTGRHILELDELGLTSLGFDGHVLLNGQLCLDGARRILSETPVPREDIERILPVFEERRIPIAFVEKDRIYINFIDGRVRAAQKAISSELPETGCWAGGAVYLVNIFAEDETVLRALERMPRCRMTRWNPYGVDIIAEGGSKAKGMERLLAHFGARQGRDHRLWRWRERYGDAGICRNRRRHGKRGGKGKGLRGLCDGSCGQRRHPVGPAAF